MSSINPHFTLQYSQPDDYRLSHDSVFFARQIFERVRERIRPDWRILDLCSGCGVIGLDFLFHCRAEGAQLPAVCDFLEVQEIYAPHFAANFRALGNPSTRVQLHLGNYADWTSPEGYDLILCNPPYFEAGSGKLSPSEFKNRCRFFLDADKETLVNSIRRLLKSGGEAYVLMRDVRDGLEVVGDIRGTSLVRIST